jgi:hypothetical protein
MALVRIFFYLYYQTTLIHDNHQQYLLYNGKIIEKIEKNSEMNQKPKNKISFIASFIVCRRNL